MRPEPVDGVFKSGASLNPCYLAYYLSAWVAGNSLYNAGIAGKGEWAYVSVRQQCDKA
jgi:hypothetical protein